MYFWLLLWLEFWFVVFSFLLVFFVDFFLTWRHFMLPLHKQIAPFHSALSTAILHNKMVLTLHNEIFCWCPETHLQERVYSELGLYTKIIMFVSPLPHSCWWLQAGDETYAERLVLKIQPLNIALLFHCLPFDLTLDIQFIIEKHF